MKTRNRKHIGPRNPLKVNKIYNLRSVCINMVVSLTSDRLKLAWRGHRPCRFCYPKQAKVSHSELACLEDHEVHSLICSSYPDLQHQRHTWPVQKEPPVITYPNLFKVFNPIPNPQILPSIILTIVQEAHQINSIPWASLKLQPNFSFFSIFYLFYDSDSSITKVKSFYSKKKKSNIV